MNAAMNAPIVIIPTFNRKQITADVLRALMRQTVRPAWTIVCDSASTDGTPEEAVKSENVTVLNVGSSSYWSAAVNAGIRKATQIGTANVLIINDDIFFRDDLIECMLLSQRQHANSIISAVQKDEQGEFWGLSYESPLKIQKRQYIQSIRGTHKLISNGCCLLISRQVFEQIGCFDEKNCPQLYADTEFQLRALKGGFRIVFAPEASIEQGPRTDYKKKFPTTQMFTHPASPLRAKAYLKFGQTLFGSSAAFAMLGVYYHTIYVKSVISMIQGSIKDILAKSSLNVFLNK